MSQCAGPLDHTHWDAVEEATELLQEQRFHEALANLRDRIREDRYNPYAYYFTGVAMFELGEIEGARDAYRATLRLAPAHMGARIGLSHSLRLLGEIRESIAVAEAARRIAPKDPDVLHALGLARAAAGQPEDAEEHLSAFIDSHPEYEAAQETFDFLRELRAKTPSKE